MSTNTVNILKGISIPLILILGLLPGVFPLFCKKCQQSPKLLSVINTFSGGIFLAVGLLHIFPETVIDFEHKHPHMAQKFPLPSTFFVAGFLLIFVFEKLACRAHHHHAHADTNQSSQRPLENPEDQPPNSVDQFVNSKIEEVQGDRTKKIRDQQRKKHISFWNSLVLVIAISIHALFEGLALGLEEVEDDMIGLFLAIVLHKWAMSLSLGILIIRQSKHKTAHVLILLMIFAVITPLGVGIGWAILNFSAGLVSIIMNAFSGGTLLYVGALEIPETEFGHDKNTQRGFKFAMYCGGFVLMMVLDVITKNTYGHSH